MGRRLNIGERLEAHSVPEPNTGCTLWFGARCSAGYGVLNVDDRLALAHRLSWEREHGSIPDGLCVLHRCDEPLCIAPGHLFLGTRTDNSEDKVRKGRQSKGPSHGVKMRGDRNGSRLHPESMARGDRSGARLHPERLVRGEKQHCAKLTEFDVVEIRRLRASGLCYRAIAEAFGLHLSTVARVSTFKSWKHVEGGLNEDDR